MFIDALSAETLSRITYCNLGETYVLNAAHARSELEWNWSNFTEGELIGETSHLRATRSGNRKIHDL